VGSNTALKDRPRLNVRGVAGAEDVTPLRVALDSTGKIVDGPLLDVSLGATLIFTSDRVKDDVAKLWSDKGVDVVRVGEKEVGQGLDLDQVLTELAKRGILQVLIEGGGKLQSRFLAEDRADKVVLYYGARFLGAGTAPPLLLVARVPCRCCSVSRCADVSRLSS
jgi:riboflavin biosynthesis pyrimidine reductase